MLRPQAEQDDAAGLEVDGDHGRASGHEVLASQPARRDDAGVRVAGRHGDLLRREALGQREERAVVVEAVRVGGDARAERVRRVDLDLDDGARREVLVACQPALQVLHRQREPIDRKIARVAHHHQRAAGRDERLQRVHAVLTDAAPVLRPRRRRLAARQDAGRLLVGEDDGVEPIAQRAGLDVRVVERRVRELVLFEHPARPALVHAGGPGLIDADAGRFHRGRGTARLLRDGAHLEAQGSRHVLHRLQRHPRRVDRRNPGACCRGAAREAQRRARLEQPVDRDSALGPRVVEGEHAA